MSKELDKEVRLAHARIQRCREEIQELKQTRCCNYVLPEGEEEHLDDPFSWDELASQEQVLKIRSLYEEAVSLAEKFNTDLDVLYEWADLLRYNKEWLPAFDLFQRVETYYKQSEASSSDQFALYARMLLCCERVHGEAAAYPYIRKVWELGLQMDNECPGEKLAVISRSLFRAVDLDWKEGRVDDDLTLLHRTLDMIGQMDEGQLPACGELKAIVIGDIAVCEVFRNEDKDLSRTLTALGLIRSILEKGSGFNRTLEASACCYRLSATLKAHGDKETALISTNLQYEILKQSADHSFKQYGPEFFCACNDLAAMWKEDDPKRALEFYRAAVDIRLRLAYTGVETYMKRETAHCFVSTDLPSLEEVYEKLLSAQENMEYGSLEEMLEESERYEMVMEAIEHRKDMEAK